MSERRDLRELAARTFPALPGETPVDRHLRDSMRAALVEGDDFAPPPPRRPLTPSRVARVLDAEIARFHVRASRYKTGGAAQRREEDLGFELQLIREALVGPPRGGWVKFFARRAAR